MKKDVDLRFSLPSPSSKVNSVLDMLNGKAVSRQEPNKIEIWARQAAQGDAQAQYELAKALTSGNPLAEKNREAVKWLKKAAEKEHAQSEHLLGVLIARGQGIRPNSQKAAELFRAAATFGYAPAQYDLARCLTWGFGCEKNPKEALTWFRLAAAQGHALSQQESAYAYLNGNGCAVDLRQATSYLRAAVLSGLSENCTALGELYLREDNPARNENEAIRWIKEAAGDGQPRAQYLLALFYESGRIRPEKADISLVWAVRSAENNYLPAYLLCARILQTSDKALPQAQIKALAILLRAERLYLQENRKDAPSEYELRRKEAELTLADSQIKIAKILSGKPIGITEILRYDCPSC